MITILRSYLSIERTRALLGGRSEGVGNVMAAAYGSIVGYGVMSTPGLVIDERVVVSGRVPQTSEIRQLLAAAVSA